MTLIAPGAQAAHLVTTFFRLRCDEPIIRDVQPSSISVLAIMAKGSGELRFIDGRSGSSHPLTFITPTEAAATFCIEGPWDVFGAMLSPVGWASLTGRSAGAEANRICHAADMLPEQVIAAAEHMRTNLHQLSNEQMRDTLSASMIASAAPLPRAHLGFIHAVKEWLAQSLSPDLADLLATTGYSARQVQRLSERYFGLAPRALARKYRALRAAILLSRPNMSAEDIAAVQDHFYDQSHMIREIRLFAGRTPAKLGDPDIPYLSSFLRQRDFHESSGRMAPIPRDLRK